MIAATLLLRARQFLRLTRWKPTKPMNATPSVTMTSCWWSLARNLKMRVPSLSPSTATPQAPMKCWFGRPWQGKPEVSTSLPASANNYFSLATFRPDEAGQYRRRKARFQALHAVMLDDVGTKMAMERLTLPPSWLLETSAGNYQAGYLLREPLADGATADRLMDAIVAAGLCDPGEWSPGAAGPTAAGGEWQVHAAVPVSDGRVVA